MSMSAEFSSSPSEAQDRGLFSLAELLATRLSNREPSLLRNALRDPGSLFSFEHLGDCLNSRLVMPPQLRLFREGAEISPREYVEAYRGNRRSLMADQLRALLSRGATMVVNNWDDLMPSTRELASALESLTGVAVGSNLYASWPPVAGFDAHYDQHDVAVLQLVGSKTWRIYDQVRSWPSASSVLPEYRDRAPLEAPVLEAGDVLFLPRGFVHAPVARECCSIHLSIAFEVVGARQLIDAAIAKASRDQGLDGDFVALDEAERADLARRLRASVADALSALSIEAFMQNRAGRPRRPAPVELSATLRTTDAARALRERAGK